MHSEDRGVTANENGYDRPKAEQRDLMNAGFRHLLAIDYIGVRVTEESLRKALVELSREDQDDVMNAGRFSRECHGHCTWIRRIRYSHGCQQEWHL